MGLYLTRSIRLAPSVRLNVGLKRASVSIGTRGVSPLWTKSQRDGASGTPALRAEQQIGMAGSIIKISPPVADLESRVRILGLPESQSAIATDSGNTAPQLNRGGTQNAVCLAAGPGR